VTYSRDYRQLRVWGRAHALTLTVFRLTRTFPNDERFGLTAQLRRSCAAIPTNLVEGSERTGVRAFAAFVDVAAASAAETEYLLFLASELGYTPNQDLAPIQQELTEIRRILTALRNSLRARGKVST
jgi:four helix bundle protein